MQFRAADGVFGEDLKDPYRNYGVRVREGPYIAVNLAKNALAPVVIPMRRSRGCFGMDGDLDAVGSVLDRLAPSLVAAEVGFAGARVLELGVGRTGEVCAAAVLAGAAHATGIDVQLQLPDGAEQGERYTELADRLATGRTAGALLAAAGADPASVSARAQVLGPGAWPLSFSAFDGTALPVADGSIDVILSKSVLEHVRREDVRPLLRDMRRALRPGGVMAHIIDLRDHMRIEGDETVHGDWLDALRYSDRLFRAMFGNRSTSINRLRVGEWRNVLREGGFEVVSEELTRFDLPEGFDRDRLHPRYRGMTDEELRVGFLTVGARRSG